MQTRAGIVMGTPPYMSPGAGRRAARRSPHGHLLAGRASSTRWPAGGGRSTARRRSSWPRRSCATRRAPISERADRPAGRVGRVIERCLEKAPRDRIQTARDVSRPASIAPARVASLRARRYAPRPRSMARRADEGFRVAVLPFKYSGASADLSALAEGLSEEIVPGLSRFSYLASSRAVRRCVVADERPRRSRRRNRRPQYVMEGSLRQAGSQVRVSLQLADASHGRTSVGGHLHPTVHPMPSSRFRTISSRPSSRRWRTHGVLPHSMRTRFESALDD